MGLGIPSPGTRHTNKELTGGGTAVITENHRKWWILLFLLVFTGGVITLIYKPYIREFLTTNSTPPRAPFTPGERTLIVAPHPDDETLGGGGVIMKALQAKKEVRVVVVTSGDGYRRAAQRAFSVKHPSPEQFRKLGELRHEETIRAMRSFGVPEDHIYFLGYPDGGMNSLWLSDWDYDQLHHGLNGADHAPYPFVYEKNAPYCGANVCKNLEDIILQYKPTDIVYPDPEDQHHDHWATSSFVKYTLTKLGYSCKEWQYLVHRGDWPQSWTYDPSRSLDPPKSLVNVGAEWYALPLDKEEAARKYQALQQYSTQVAVMGEFLFAFVRKNDLIEQWPKITLPTVEGEPDFRQAGTLPYLVIPDAVSDSLTRELEGEADIRGVAAVLTRDHLYLAMETRRAIHANVEYSLRFRAFAGSDIKRMDLFITGDKMEARPYAKNSLSLPKEATLSIEGNRLWVKLPRSLVAGATSLYLNADTFLRNEQVDKTAWRLIDLPCP
jgi:N-acetyl-1-D-myo-inositol-2-amino-2-deoxy-alpha-D-glucopyranoside deacetylase